MRKYLILLLLFSSPAFGQIKTITGGGYQYPNGSPCSGCTLTLQLTNDAVVQNNGQIAPKKLSYTLDANGNVPSGSTLWGNDQLNPNGTTYKASLAAVGGGQIWGPEYFFIAGLSPINLAQLIPVANPAVFFNNPGLSVVAKVDLTAQAASIAQTTLYSVPANGAGTYRASCYVVTTQAATTSSTLPSCQINFTDNDTSTAQNAILTQTTTANVLGVVGAVAANIQDPFINAKASTVIQYQTNSYASVGATPMQYAVHIKLEYLGL